MSTLVDSSQGTEETLKQKFSLRAVVAELRAERLPLELPRWLRWALILIGLGVAVWLPLSQPTYANFNLSMVMVYAVAGLGLNLLTGYMGQLSLGHSAFFAVGAYTTAVLIDNGFHYLLTLPIAAVVCFCFGYVIGLPALRLRGLQLALVTLALALVVPAAIKRLDNWTHGQEGINLFTAEPPPALGIERDQWIYYLCLIVLVLAIIVTRRLTSGRIGRALVAIRNNETAVSTLGVRTSRLKTTVFAISAAYAGIAGTLYVYTVQFVGPDAFGLTLAIALISLIVVGGLGTVSGAVLGAFFIHYIPTITADINQAAAGLTYGVVLIAFMFVMPFGIVGLVRYVLKPVVDRIPRSG